MWSQTTATATDPVRPIRMVRDTYTVDSLNFHHVPSEIIISLNDAKLDVSKYDVNMV